MRFQSLSVGSIRFGTASATLRGMGLVNGRRVSFTAVAIDHGAHGDVFHISWLHGLSLGGRVHGSVCIR